MTRDHLRPSHLNIVPYISGIPESQSLARHFAHDTLGEIVTQTGGQLLVVHTWIVCDLSPELGNFGWVPDLEFEFTLRPLNEVCVGRNE